MTSSVPQTSSIYRTYKRLLPQLDNDALANLGQGRTALIQSRRIGPAVGLQKLYFKLETSNPTGSYKDRFAGLALALAKERGAKACFATSSGNTGAALAAFGAALGISVIIFVNERTPVGKLVQMRAHGARIFRVEGMGIDAYESSQVIELLRRESSARNVPLLVSAFAQSPEGMAGIKTMAYEIVETLGSVRHVFCPVGGGGLFCALAQGFLDLSKTATVVPRMHPVQPALNDTMVTALQLGHDHGRTVSTTTTLSGLAVPFDLDGTRAISFAKATCGDGILIEDEEALAAQRCLMLDEGLLVEPAGAVSVAGCLKAAREGRLQSNEPIVCILTGHGFKDPASLELAAERNPIDLVGRNGIQHLLDATCSS